MGKCAAGRLGYSFPRGRVFRPTSMDALHPMCCQHPFPRLFRPCVPITRDRPPCTPFVAPSLPAYAVVVHADRPTMTSAYRRGRAARRVPTADPHEPRPEMEMRLAKWSGALTLHRVVKSRTNSATSPTSFQNAPFPGSASSALSGGSPQCHRPTRIPPTVSRRHRCAAPVSIGRRRCTCRRVRGGRGCRRCPG